MLCRLDGISAVIKFLHRFSVRSIFTSIFSFRKLNTTYPHVLFLFCEWPVFVNLHQFLEFSSYIIPRSFSLIWSILSKTSPKHGWSLSNMQMVETIGVIKVTISSTLLKKSSKETPIITSSTFGPSAIWEPFYLCQSIDTTISLKDWCILIRRWSMMNVDTNLVSAHQRHWRFAYFL